MSDIENNGLYLLLLNLAMKDIKLINVIMVYITTNGMVPFRFAIF